jgi:2-aminoadipate transaminase
MIRSLSLTGYVGHNIYWEGKRYLPNDINFGYNIHKLKIYFRKTINIAKKVDFMEFDNLFSQAALRMKSSKIRELMKYASMPGVISFGGGSPDSDNLPFEDVKNIINKWDSSKIKAAMQYGTTSGYAPLLNKINERMKIKKNINTDGSDIIITTGGQQAIYLISKIFINPGDIVLVEEPSFIGGMAAFLSNGADLVGVKLNGDGVDTDHLEEILNKLKKEGKTPKFFYTIPNFQNPGGVTMSQEKRKKVYEISKKYNLLVLEDDPYSDLYFSGEQKDYFPIKSYGNDAPIIYLGSFSKILCPGFRLGWILADKKIIEKAGLAKQSIDACSSSFGQVIANDYLESNAIDNYLNKMRIIYKDKKNLMVQKIESYFPSEVKHTNPNGGFFIYVDLPNGISADKLFRRTIEKKVAFVTGDPFHTDFAEGDKHMRISFSGSTNQDIETGIKIIGESMKEMI